MLSSLQVLERMFDILIYKISLLFWWWLQNIYLLYIFFNLAIFPFRMELRDALRGIYYSILQRYIQNSSISIFWSVFIYREKRYIYIYICYILLFWYDDLRLNSNTLSKWFRKPLTGIIQWHNVWVQYWICLCDTICNIYLNYWQNISFIFYLFNFVLEFLGEKYYVIVLQINLIYSGRNSRN